MLGFLKAGKRFFITTLLWIPLSLSIVFLISEIQGSRYWESALFVIPPMMLELFICMSIWYLCRAVKIEKVFFLKNFLIHILTAFLLNFIWIVLMVLYAKFLDDLFKSTKWTQMFNQILPVFLHHF